MLAADFIAKWRAADLSERAAAQSHFRDLCDLIGEKAPTDADPKGEWYAFEKGATKKTGGEGWADVWKRGCFGWEYKSKGKDLRAAFAQLQRYAPALENPPLLIVCDLARFEIHTNWTNTVSRTYEIGLDELADYRKLRWLKWAFTEPERLKPGLTRQALTEQAAAEFARLAQRLRDRGHPSQTGGSFHQPARLLHVRRGRRPVAGQDVRAHARQCGALRPANSRHWLRPCSQQCARADGSGSNGSTGSTAGSSTTTARYR